MNDPEYLSPSYISHFESTNKAISVLSKPIKTSTIQIKKTWPQYFIANPKIITIFVATFDISTTASQKHIRIGSVAQLDRATAF